MRRLRIVFLALSILVSSSGGTSWAEGSFAPVPSAGAKIKGCNASGTVSFMFWGDMGEKIEQHTDVQLAEKSCPGLHVVEIWDQGNYDADLAKRIAAGNAPDVFQLDPEKYLPQYVRQGALANLDPFISRDKLNMSEIYWPSCLPETMYRNHVWGLLRDCSSQGILFYNKDMFDARHVNYPTDNWTYRDFLAAAQRLTGDYALPSDPISKLRFGYAWNNDDYRVNQYVWGWGGDWLSKDLKTCTLDSRPARAALTWWRDLRYKYHGAPTAEQFNVAGNYISGFKDQHYAMTFAGAWALNYMLRPSAYTGSHPVAFRWGAALTPRGPRTRQALLGAALEVISRTSKNKNASWWLARFLTQGAGGALEGTFGIGIPGSVKLAQNPSVRTEYGSLLRVLTEASKYGRGMRVVPQYTEFWDAVDKDLDPMWSNTESVAAATSAACRDVAPYLP